MMKKRFTLIKTAIVLAALLLPVSLVAQSTGRGTLKAGAAKVDITPAESELPKNSLGILDHVHARAIVVTNGLASAALVSVDVGGIPTPVVEAVAKRTATEFGIPAGNLLITGTHTHSGPRIETNKMTEYIYQAIKTAFNKMEPANLSYGTGVSYINVNRNIWDDERKGWWEGPNYEGESDKTVSVAIFRKLNGDPIAVYYNYAMHAVAAGQLDMISGDAPGAASAYIEDSFADKIVALWSTGACGDQNPIYFQQTFDLRDIRIADYAARGEDISNAMPPGGTGLDRNNPRVVTLLNQQKQICQSMGQMLGEEVLRVMRTTRRSENSIRIASAQKSVSFPGRKRLNSGRAGYEGQYEDSDSVSVKLYYLQIDDIAVCALGSEVFNHIANRLKKESPFARTMMVTLTNGWTNTGYIPNDEAYGFQTFEVLSSRVKPGYAESGIVNGFLDLMQETKY